MHRGAGLSALLRDIDGFDQLARICTCLVARGALSPALLETGLASGGLELHLQIEDLGDTTVCTLIALTLYVVISARRMATVVIVVVVLAVTVTLLAAAVANIACGLVLRFDDAGVVRLLVALVVLLIAAAPALAHVDRLYHAILSEGTAAATIAAHAIVEALTEAHVTSR